MVSQANDDEIVTDTSEEIVLAIGSPTPKYQSPFPSKRKATPDKLKERRAIQQQLVCFVAKRTTPWKTATA
jgi:hypothetical protein